MPKLDEIANHIQAVLEAKGISIKYIQEEAYEESISLTMELTEFENTPSIKIANKLLDRLLELNALEICFYNLPEEAPYKNSFFDNDYIRLRQIIYSDSTLNKRFSRIDIRPKFTK